MNPRLSLSTGLHRGGIELHQTARSVRECLTHVVNIAIFVAVAVWRGGTVKGSDVQTSAVVLAGEVAAVIISTAWTTLPQVMATERQDGTLLRLRGIPHAVPAYVIGKTLYTSVIAVASAVILLVAGAAANDNGLPQSPQDWATLAWVLLLGLLAVVPVGIAIGAALPNARGAVALLLMPVFGLMAVSGVFFPVTTMPAWLQTVAECFPLKWLAQGIRSATLPDSELVAETGHSWQHWQTAGVLTAWSIAGLLIAPAVIRRTSRRATGSRRAPRPQPSRNVSEGSQR
ncbi:ABC transporter permease [Streptomyces puniciscabiei]